MKISLGVEYHLQISSIAFSEYPFLLRRVVIEGDAFFDAVVPSICVKTTDLH